MIKETHVAIKEKIVPQGDVVVDISGFTESPFVPSQDLLSDWNQDRIVWKDYVERYYQELKDNREVARLIQEIADLAAREDVWLVSMEREYPCHRFLVKQIIERILVARGVLAEPEDYSESYRRYKNLTRSEVTRLRQSKRNVKPVKGHDFKPFVPIVLPKKEE
jgi:hypothetical protein